MLQTGARAPSFALTDLEGRTQRLEVMLARGPALVAFVKNDCGACQLAFPYLQRLWATYQEHAWSFLVVAQDRPEAIKRQVEKHGMTMPVAVEHGDYPVSKAYDPEATPTYFWILPNGVVSRTAIGFLKKDLNELAALIAGRSDADTPDIAPPDDGTPSYKPG